MSRRLALAAVALLALAADGSAASSPHAGSRRALRAALPASTTGEGVVRVPSVAAPIVAVDDDDAVDADPAASSGPAASSDASASASLDGRDAPLSTGVTPDFVRSVAGTRGAVIVTWANDHYRDFARSWVSRLRALNLTNFMVGAMDETLHGHLLSIDVPTWLMGSRDIDAKAVRNDFGWGSSAFHKMGRDKIRLIRDFTRVDGVDVLISDIDVAWFRDPVPFFRRYPAADILVSSDLLRSEIDKDPASQAPRRVDGEGLEFHMCHAASNIGMMWFRPTPGSRELTSRWVDAIEKDDKLWDQNAFNDLVRSEGGCEGRGKAEAEAEDVDPGLFRAFGGRVVVGTLPVAQFANGHVFYAQRTHSRLGLAPYAVHNTFQYGGTPGKRHRMREANAWLGDALASSRGGAGGKRDERSEEEEALDGSPGGSDYFAGGFLSYDPAIPRDVDLEQFRERSHPVAKDDTFPVIATPDDPVVDAHARLVEYQLAQMYAAMAVAKRLGRTLIAPPFLCGLDRVWFPHYGRFPGSEFALPFVCPLDHVAAVERAKPSLEAVVRESAFLTHPEMPRRVLDSVALVSVVGGDGEKAPFADENALADENNATAAARTWVPFPGDVPRCLTGPGTGGDAKGFEGAFGPSRAGAGALVEKERCGWAGARERSSRPRRRAILTLDAFERGPEAVAAALAGVRTSAVLHLDAVAPLAEALEGFEGAKEEKNAEGEDVRARRRPNGGARKSKSPWAKLVGEAKDALPPDVWCCSQKGHRAYVV